MQEKAFLTNLANSKQKKELNDLKGQLAFENVNSTNPCSHLTEILRDPKYIIGISI